MTRLSGLAGIFTIWNEQASLHLITAYPRTRIAVLHRNIMHHIGALFKLPVCYVAPQHQCTDMVRHVATQHIARIV